MSTASFNRSKTGDRFYNPPARRQLQQQQQLEEIREQKVRNHQLFNRNQMSHRRRKSAEEAVVEVAETTGKSSEDRAELDDCASRAMKSVTTATPVVSVSPSLSSSSNSTTTSTNLEQFLEFTTPFVTAQHFSKTAMKGWRTQDDEFRPYFVLGDLWESFKEWSAYGAGVPLLLNGRDSVVQYYVPYLSGIQLYIDPSKPSPITRRPGEESDESSRETSSNGSSDCEMERGLNSFGVWEPQDIAESNQLAIQGLPQRVKTSNGSSSDGESSSSPGALVYEYFEHDPPFNRKPLADKISYLTTEIPELKTYRSCDLSSSSWLSVAWYPIYRIPTGPTLQNLDACFLTFHSLSTPVTGRQNEWQCHLTSCPSIVSNCLERADKLPLPTFGLACYKFKISMWDQNAVEDSPKANSLLQAAGEWLRHLNVNLPDYSFFSSHKYWR